MPRQYTLEEFGKRIKAKYPQYASFSDADIANKVLAKYPQYKADIIPSITPEARTVGNYASEITRGVGRGIVDDAAGLYQSLRHPLDTAQSVADQAGVAGNAAKQEFEQTKAAPLYQRGVAGALTFLENAPLIGGMVQKAEEGGGRVASPEAAGAAAEGITAFGLPDLAARGAAKVVPKATELFRASMKRAGGASPADITEAAQNAVDENAKAAKNHLEETQDAVNARREERSSVIQKNRENEAAHKAQSAEVKAHNQRALDEQKAREETPRKLKEASSELRARIETAREKALKVGNEKYSTVNEKLNPIGADMETVIGGIGDAMDKIKGSDTEPAIIKDIDKKVGEGEALTYKDLQGYYSELNKELSKGTLAGDVFAAYDTLHDAIGNEMQRIADSQGMGQHLSDARNYWRRMKQTFGKPFTPGDVASQTLKGVNPDFVRDEEMANRLRLLGSFDPEIPKTAGHIGNLQRGLDALPKEKPLRDILKQNPAPPQSSPVPSMRDAEVPDRPQETTLSPDTLKAMQKAKIQGTGQAMQNSKTASVIGHALTGFGSTWALVEAMRGDLRYAGDVLAARITIGLAQKGVGAMLADPKFAEWLAKPTAKDIEALKKLTPEQKAVFANSLQSVLQQAPKQGIRVDPRITALVTGASVAGNTSRKRVAGALSATVPTAP